MSRQHQPKRKAYPGANAYSNWNRIPEPALIHGVVLFSNGSTAAGC
jgi:hypothetical protein